MLEKDKSEDPRTDFFNMNFEHLPIRMRDPNADVAPEKPVMFEKNEISCWNIVKRMSSFASRFLLD